jgi:hypothetical protein
MKKYLSISIASILALSAPGIAKAQFYITADIGGVPTVSGATLENFDEPTPSILTLSGSANLVTGANYGVAYYPPYFSGSTAAFFGESPTSGFDNSQYVAVEFGDSASATLSFPTPQKYLGLLWGSVGVSDSLTFYDSANNVIGTVLGTDVPGAVFNGQVGLSNTSYVNITSTTAFSSVVATSPASSFEFDDVAYAQVVPEPASSVLFGAELCILGFALRWKFAKSAGIELD